MLHHLSFGVSDIVRASKFYDAVLAPLGYSRVYTSESFVGYGVEEGKDKFALKLDIDGAAPGSGFHLAFSAPSQQAVDQFHELALQHGATDNGLPSLRKQYGPHYYAAFVIDPDGHRIEAVTN